MRTRKHGATTPATSMTRLPEGGHGSTVSRAVLAGHRVSCRARVPVGKPSHTDVLRRAEGIANRLSRLQGQGRNRTTGITMEPLRRRSHRASSTRTLVVHTSRIRGITLPVTAPATAPATLQYPLRSRAPILRVLTTRARLPNSLPTTIRPLINHRQRSVPLSTMGELAYEARVFE